MFETIVGVYFGREAVAPIEEILIAAPLKLSATAAARGQVVMKVVVDDSDRHEVQESRQSRL